MRAKNRIQVMILVMFLLCINAYGKVIKKEGKIPDGIVKKYSETGQLKAEYNYKNGKQDGIGIFYNDDGITPKQIDIFKNDKLIKRKIYDFNGKLLTDQSYPYPYKDEETRQNKGKKK